MEAALLCSHQSAFDASTFFDCGWSLLNHGVADTKRLNLGNLNPIYEREFTKLELHQGEGRWSVSKNGASEAVIKNNHEQRSRTLVNGTCTHWSVTGRDHQFGGREHHKPSKNWYKNFRRSRARQTSLSMACGGQGR